MKKTKQFVVYFATATNTFLSPLIYEKPKRWVAWCWDGMNVASSTGDSYFSSRWCDSFTAFPPVVYGDFPGGAFTDGLVGGMRRSFYLVSAVRDVTLWRFIHNHAFIGAARGTKGIMLPKFLAYLVVLCFERRCPKQNYSCSLKIEIFHPSQNFGLAELRRSIFFVELQCFNLLHVPTPFFSPSPNLCSKPVPKLHHLPHVKQPFSALYL